jgi:secreted PhoX family phosphatase
MMVLRHSSNRHFCEVLEEVDRSRRRLLKSGLGAAALAFFGAPSLLKPTAAFAGGPAFASLPLAPFPADPATRPGSVGDTVRVAEGYRSQVLIAWGDPIKPGFAPFSGTANETAEHQANSYGAHTDGMHFFPFPQRGAANGLSNERGILAANNEYVDQGLLFPDGVANWNDPRIGPAKVKKALAAHGVTIVEIRKGANGIWAPVLTAPFNRRITGETPIAISGPAAGHPLMKTPGDSTGTRVLGTLNNCANGYTPWGTYLACEENFNGYFASTNAFSANQLEGDYGLSAAGSGYRWHENEPRFDLSGYAIDPGSSEPSLNRNNEPNRFGWVVELDPFNPTKRPVKRTALGRIKHEGAVYALAKDGRVVLYMGDDQANEYIYKFVTSNAYNPHNRTANANLLDEGTLYVAKFNAGDTIGDKAGTGEWLPLTMTNTAINSFFGGDLGAMLINTRRAADLAGATPMDRPEWIAVNPLTGAVYCTLTNNSARSAATADDANPRAPNRYGHIIRWNEALNDAAATRFEWDIFVLAGDPVYDSDDPDTLPDQPGDIDGDTFGSPDGLWFDKDGRLWIQTDISSSALGTGFYANMPNNMMLCADPQTRQIRRFLTGPYGCEVTGITSTPDCQTFFVGIQHPGEGAGDSGDPTRPEGVSKWPSCQGYGPPGRPRSGVVIITKAGGGVIGS